MDASQIGKLIFAYLLIFFWTGVTSLRMLLGILWFRGEFFRVKPRPKKPQVLIEGWNHKFVNLSDIKLHYVSCGDEKKPLMLMLHGFPEFWYSWHHQMNEFTDNYHVVAIDMRGYGESDKPRGTDKYKMDLLVKDIKEFISAIGYTSCVLVAHDWGGVVGWRVAASYPDMVEKLIILNAPNSDAMALFLKDNPKQLLKSWYIFFFQAPFLPELMIRARDFFIFDGMTKSMSANKPDDVEAIKYTYSQPGAITAPINYYRASLMGRLIAPPSEPTIIQPKTLIIWGTNDIALETGLATMSANYCREATVELVEGASHFVHEDRPEVVTQCMKKWLGAP